MRPESSGPIFNFNPRTHVGCDLRPARRYGRPLNFNPRTHVGCDRFGAISFVEV